MPIVAEMVGGPHDGLLLWVRYAPWRLRFPESIPVDQQLFMDPSQLGDGPKVLVYLRDEKYRCCAVGNHRTKYNYSREMKRHE